MTTVQKFYWHSAASTLHGTLPGAATQSATTPTVTFAGASTDRQMDGTIGVLQVGPTGASAAQSTKQNNWFRRFVSQPLAAQTFGSGTWQIRAAIKVSNISSPWQISACVYVWRPSNGTRIGIVLDAVTTGVGTAATAVETDTTLVALSGSGSNVTCIAGDILVIEVWGTVTQTSTTSRTWTLFFDGTTEGSTTSNAAFINAPAAITLLAPVVVTGAEAPSEKDKVVVSEKPGASAAPSETSKLVVSEKPTGAEHPSETSTLTVSAKPPGAASITEGFQLTVSARPPAAAHPSETGTILVSAKPPGSASISEGFQLVLSAKPVATASVSVGYNLVVTNPPPPPPPPANIGGGPSGPLAEHVPWDLTRPTEDRDRAIRDAQRDYLMRELGAVPVEGPEDAWEAVEGTHFFDSEEEVPGTPGWLWLLLGLGIGGVVAGLLAYALRAPPSASR